MNGRKVPAQRTSSRHHQGGDVKSLGGIDMRKLISLYRNDYKATPCIASLAVLPLKPEA